MMKDCKEERGGAEGQGSKMERYRHSEEKRGGPRERHTQGGSE